jgi:hypothetical protein
MELIAFTICMPMILVLVAGTIYAFVRAPRNPRPPAEFDHSKHFER